jgi:hypothetical protein
MPHENMIVHMNPTNTKQNACTTNENNNIHVINDNNNMFMQYQHHTQNNNDVKEDKNCNMHESTTCMIENNIVDVNIDQDLRKTMKCKYKLFYLMLFTQNKITQLTRYYLTICILESSSQRASCGGFSVRNNTIR